VRKGSVIDPLADRNLSKNKHIPDDPRHKSEDPELKRLARTSVLPRK
jgi:hypothetical protein